MDNCLNSLPPIIFSFNSIMYYSTLILWFTFSSDSVAKK